MFLVDTHAHINFEDFNDDRELVMLRAYEAGIKKLIHSCTEVKEIQEILDLSEKYNGSNSIDLYCSIGVHPIYIQTWSEGSIEEMSFYLESKSLSKKIKAIGETGLDYFHITDLNEQKKQRDIFKEHIKLAKKFKLPIILHTRDAWDDTLSIIEEFYPIGSNLSGVLHCYTGDTDFALKAIDRGFYISWSGIVTFKKTENLRKVAKEIPLDKTLIETDCPFLAPQAKRGERNEPAFVKHVAESLSETLGIELEKLAKITTKNAETLFKI